MVTCFGNIFLIVIFISQAYLAFWREGIVVFGMSKQANWSQTRSYALQTIPGTMPERTLAYWRAVESLMRTVVDAGSIIGFSDKMKLKEKDHGIEDILFKSRLSRLECIVDLESK